MNKRNLEFFHFYVRSDSTDEPLRVGQHHTIYKYLKKELKKEEIDDLEVSAIDVENNFSIDPLPAKKWLEWWEDFVLPALLENDFNDDLMIKYPDAGIDLTEL